MKFQRILVAVLLLALIVVIGKWLQRPTEQRREGRVGEMLVSHQIVESARQIHLSDPSEEETVTLVKGPENAWILPDYHSFEVDFSKLESLIRSLLEAKVDREVTKDPERLKRLELGKNRIEFKSSDTESLLIIETGKRSPSGGTFIKFDGDDSAYLSDLSLYLDTNESNWPRKKMLSFTPSEVARLHIGGTEGALAARRIHRESADTPFTSDELDENWQINDSEVKNLLRTLINARFSKVAEKDDPDVSAALAHAREFELSLFSGGSYSLSIGQRPSEPVEEAVAAEVAAAAGPDEAQIVDADDATQTGDAEEPLDEPEMTDPGPVFIFYSTSDPGNRLNEIMGKVALTYPEYTFNQINDALEKIVEAAEREEEEDNVEPSE